MIVLLSIILPRTQLKRNLFHLLRWSQQRYVLGHDGIAFYEDNDVLIDYLQAINITATMADKGE